MSATLSNWREPPYNVWAFRNVEKLIATHTISKGDRTSTLESKPKSFENFSVQLGDSPTFDLASLLNYTSTDGFIVLHYGKVVFEHYANDNDATSKHIIMSMTKSITGLVAGILSARKELDLGAPVKKYVPTASRIYDNVTVQELLDMRSGVKADDNTHEYRAAAGWNPLRGDEKASAKSMHAFIEGLDADVDESKGMNYSSVNTDLLGWVLEAATGKKLAELISELLWKPMGAESDALITVDSEGSARAAGGACVTLRDIARLGQLLADGGRDIVPKAWIDDMLHGGDSEAFAAGTFGPAFRGVLQRPHYRDCWIVDPERDMFCALGIFGQQLMVNVKHGIVVAKTSSMEGPIDFGRVRVQTAAFEEVKKVLLN